VVMKASREVGRGSREERSCWKMKNDDDDDSPYQEEGEEVG
jgi:hypothetical protein